MLIRAACFTLAALSLLSPSLLAQEENRKLIVCSTTQIADFARQVVGDRCEVQCVLAPGQDPHLYRITESDIRLIASADLCLQNGWHLEGGEWMARTAEANGKEKVLVTCLTGVKPIKLEEQGEEVNDPHAWFSPLNAAIYVRNILNAVKQLEPEHSSEFDARAELYLEQLRTLHAWTTRQISAIPPNQRVLVTSHDAFNYFCQAYRFKSAAPVGWSTDELGAGLTAKSRRETVASIQRQRVKAIFVETSVNKKLIQEIADEAGVAIGGELYSDSMGRPGSAGEKYIGMMRENVLTIVNALN